MTVSSAEFDEDLKNKVIEVIRKNQIVDVSGAAAGYAKIKDVLGLHLATTEWYQVDKIVIWLKGLQAVRFCRKERKLYIDEHKLVDPAND